MEQKQLKMWLPSFLTWRAERFCNTRSARQVKNEGRNKQRWVICL